MLLLLDGKEIHVGDTTQKIEELLGKRAQAAALEVDQGPLGERQTRFYEYAGTRLHSRVRTFRAPRRTEGWGDLLALK